MSKGGATIGFMAEDEPRSVDKGRILTLDIIVQCQDTSLTRQPQMQKSWSLVRIDAHMYALSSMTITLSPENSASFAEYCELIAWTPEQLANHLLADALDLFADPRSGSLEGFLGSIDYPDRATADRALARVAQIVTIQFDGKLPESFQGQVQELELDAGHFGVTAQVIGHHGELLEVC